MQNINPIGNETIGGNLEWVVAFGDQTAFNEIGGVGQLDAGVANRRTTKALENPDVLANSIGDFEEVSLEQALVAVLVGDDLDLGCHLGVALDQSANRGGQTRRKSTRGEERDLFDGHGKPFVRCVR